MRPVTSKSRGLFAKKHCSPFVGNINQLFRLVSQEGFHRLFCNSARFGILGIAQEKVRTSEKSRIEEFKLGDSRFRIGRAAECQGEALASIPFMDSAKKLEFAIRCHATKDRDEIVGKNSGASERFGHTFDAKALNCESNSSIPNRIIHGQEF